MSFTASPRMENSPFPRQALLLVAQLLVLACGATSCDWDAAEDLAFERQVEIEKNISPREVEGAMSQS